MKIPRNSLLLMAVLAAAVVPLTVSADAIPGQPAPDFSLTALDGRTYELGDLRGRTIVLEWTNPECPFVKKHYGSGNIRRLQKSATDDGVVWLTINSGRKGAQGDYGDDEVRAWLEKTGAAPTAYARDRSGTVGRAYGAKTTPHMYVINPEGTLIYAGAIDSIRSANVKDIDRAENYVTAALAAVKSGGLPPKSTSEPYGCSVKY